MPVYLIRAGDTEFVKIGWADDPVARCAELQTAHHEELRIIRIINCHPSGERWLHRHFARLRVRGEWFRFETIMLDIEPPEFSNEAPKDADPILFDIETFLARTGTTATAFGRDVAGDPTLVHELRRGRECRRALTARIANFLAASAN